MKGGFRNMGFLTKYVYQQLIFAIHHTLTSAQHVVYPRAMGDNEFLGVAHRLPLKNVCATLQYTQSVALIYTRRVGSPYMLHSKERSKT